MTARGEGEANDRRFRWVVAVAGWCLTIVGVGPALERDQVMFELVTVALVVAFLLYLLFVRTTEGTVAFGVGMIAVLVIALVWVYGHGGYASLAALLLPLIMLGAASLAVVGDRAIRHRRKRVKPRSGPLLFGAAGQRGPHAERDVDPPGDVSLRPAPPAAVSKEPPGRPADHAVDAVGDNPDEGER
jgi:hypothetical protein